jgi:hypothetical protein
MKNQSQRWEQLVEFRQVLPDEWLILVRYSRLVHVSGPFKAIWMADAAAVGYTLYRLFAHFHAPLAFMNRGETFQIGPLS